MAFSLDKLNINSLSPQQTSGNAKTVGQDSVGGWSRVPVHDHSATADTANLFEMLVNTQNLNSVTQQPMSARGYCAHPSIRDRWALRCMSRCPDQVFSMKRDPQCLSPQASLVLVYRTTAVGMKG
ncbi:uncharacterized protein TNCV_3554211 [Trichonephila clavipes]|nr:uncharacterized protein TNCV_3554211 [Trichonephila clavipes]